MAKSITSVPTVIPLQEIKLKVAKLLELYESKMKEAANMGRRDRAYLNRVGAALELVEAIAARS
jgi:hypothetical protein